MINQLSLFCELNETKVSDENVKILRNNLALYYGSQREAPRVEFSKVLCFGHLLLLKTFMGSSDSNLSFNLYFRFET